jgi:hypothetical protein
MSEPRALIVEREVGADRVEHGHQRAFECCCVVAPLREGDRRKPGAVDVETFPGLAARHGFELCVMAEATE